MIDKGIIKLITEMLNSPYTLEINIKMNKEGLIITQKQKTWKY